MAEAVDGALPPPDGSDECSNIREACELYKDEDACRVYAEQCTDAPPPEGDCMRLWDACRADDGRARLPAVLDQVLG